MALEQFLKDELIKINLKCDNQDQLFEALYSEALNHGYVKEPFLKKIKEREAEFPTGLSMNAYSVAIPHTDPEYVLEQFIAVVTLEKPVPFRRMDDKSKLINVNVVLMLGFKEPHNQLKVLQEIMRLIQDRSTIERILAAKTSEEIREVFGEVK